MNVTTVFITIAVIVFVVAKRVRGEAVPAPKKLFLLPIIVSLIGFQSMTHAKFNAVDIAVVAMGCALSLGLGLLRGQLDKVSEVDGAPFMSWSVASVGIFAVNVLAKVVVDVGGVAAGGTTAALSSSILFSLGLTFLGEAAVVWFRTQSLTAGNVPPEGRYRGHVQASGRPTVWPPIR
jgi:hypothetical protein